MTDNTNDENKAKYRVVTSNSDTRDIYDYTLTFLDEAVNKYASKDTNVTFSPAETISGVTHCMLKVMFENMGYENTINWLEEVKKLHSTHETSRKLTSVKPDNNQLH